MKFQAWKKLNLVLTYSTEAFLFITDPHQSPFNVGLDLSLIDFDRMRVEALNWQHGSPVKTPQEMDSIMELSQGHPFLVRKVLYTLTAQQLSLEKLLEQACDQDGPFSDHLQRYLLRLQRDQELSQAMKSVIQNHTCPTDLLFYKLRSGGLVVGPARNNVRPRCGLYAQFFKQHL